MFQGLNSFNSNHDCSVMDSEDEHNDTVENNKNEPPMKTVADEDEEENLNNDDTPEPDDNNKENEYNSNENVSKYSEGLKFKNELTNFLSFLRIQFHHCIIQLKNLYQTPLSKQSIAIATVTVTQTKIVQ